MQVTTIVVILVQATFVKVTVVIALLMIEKKLELHTRARIQAVSRERCPFSNEILTFLTSESSF